MEATQGTQHTETLTGGIRKPAGVSQGRREAEARRYAPAVGLYASGGRSLSEAAALCGVRTSGLAAHVSRYHHDIARSRYGISAGPEELLRVRTCQQAGQTRSTHLKYRRAIEACGDIAYIEFNVQQIARLFRLNGNALTQQLRTYYPELLEQRERARRKLGIATRGPRRETTGVYSEALDMFRDTDMSLTQTAEKCGVSRCGFSRFMRCYHSDLVRAKEESKKADRLLLHDMVRDRMTGKRRRNR